MNHQSNLTDNKNKSLELLVTAPCATGKAIGSLCYLKKKKTANTIDDINFVTESFWPVSQFVKRKLFGFRKGKVCTKTNPSEHFSCIS